jgi:hypothetical protein
MPKAPAPHLSGMIVNDCCKIPRTSHFVKDLIGRNSNTLIADWLKLLQNSHLCTLNQQNPMENLCI